PMSRYPGRPDTGARCCSCPAPGTRQARHASHVRVGDTVARVSTDSTGPFGGLPADVVQVMTSAPVQEKVLAEGEVAWPDLSGTQARMAEALRVFLVTWDPLEHDVSRPVAFATVDAGPPGLEVEVYVPVWDGRGGPGPAGGRGGGR